MSDVPPIFGSVPAGVFSRPRRAAYAVIHDRDGRVAAVEHQGRHFLPGGGSLARESPEETVMREVREELGRAVVILGSIGSAVQHFFASDDKCWYSMDAVFFGAALQESPIGAGENEITWLRLDQAEASFFHACHTWAALRA